MKMLYEMWDNCRFIVSTRMLLKRPVIRRTHREFLPGQGLKGHLLTITLPVPYEVKPVISKTFGVRTKMDIDYMSVDEDFTGDGKSHFDTDKFRYS